MSTITITISQSTAEGLCADGGALEEAAGYVLECLRSCESPSDAHSLASSLVALNELKDTIDRALMPARLPAKSADQFVKGYHRAQANGADQFVKGYHRARPEEIEQAERMAQGVAALSAPPPRPRPETSKGIKGSHLLAFRKERGISQRKAGALIGVSQASWGAWERQRKIRSIWPQFRDSLYALLRGA